MNANQQQPQQPNQPPAPGQAPPMAPGGQPMMGGQGQKFPHQQNMMGGAPGAMGAQNQMFMQQQMAGGQPQFFQNQRGGHQQYRQKAGGHGYQGGNPAQQMMGGPQMFASMPAMGGMPAVMNMGMGPMPIGGQLQSGVQSGQPPVKKEFMGVSLYIGNLSPKTFDLDLYKHFKSKGYAIAGVKVMFSKESRQSRGYGYLNFYSDEEAQRCLEGMNNAVIDGKQIVLSKKKDKDFDSKANVLVRNLPKEMDQKALSDLFAQYGNIKSAKLEVFQDGQSRGFGYIQFETQESAEKAIKELNNSKQLGKQIEVQCHVKKEDREEQGENYTNLFIQNLPHDFSDDELKKLFAPFGTIGSASVNMKKNGTGFVSFKSHEHAKAALEGTHMKTKVKDQSILVSQHIQRKENDLAPSASNPIIKNQKEAFKSNIFVRFIPKDVTEEQLKTKFSEAGPIASIKLKDHMQTINGEAFSNYKIGYVLYEDVQSAQRCIKMFDEQNCFGFAQKPLSVDFWQSQVDLKQQTEEKNAANLKQLINYVMSQNKTQYQVQGMQSMQWNQNSPTQMMGEGHKGNKYNNRGRGGNRGGGRGQGRGGHSQGKNQHNNSQNPQQNQRHQGGQQQYGNNKQTGAQGASAGSKGGNQELHGQQQQQQQNFLQLPQVDLTSFEQIQGEERKNFVGNSIYPAIQQVYGDQIAGIITGMLLDEQAVDPKELLTNNSFFVSKVNEAHAIYMNHLKQQQQ